MKTALRGSMKPGLWDAAQPELRQFNAFLKKARGWKRGLFSDEVVQAHFSVPAEFKLVEDAAYGDGGWHPADPSTNFGQWYIGTQDRADRADMVAARGTFREAFWELRRVLRQRKPGAHTFLNQGVVGLEAYSVALNKTLRRVGPIRFNYAGYRIDNPDRLTDPVLKRMLDGVDYMLALFKRRGVEPLLPQMVKNFVLRFHYASDESHLGWYRSGQRQITFVHTALTAKNPRYYEKWVHEILVHEFGHLVHLDYLHPRAKAEYDSGWMPVQEAEATVDQQYKITLSDRQRYWGYIQDAGFSPQKAGRKVKGLDRLRYLYWLHNPMVNSITSTPGQVRLTGYGKRLFEFFKDTDGWAWQRYPPPDYNETERQGMILRTIGRYSENLSIRDENTHDLSVDIETAEKIKAQDTSVAEAIAALELPSGYAGKNVKEDFAETFALFMLNPTRLSDQAKFRIQRAMSLSGLYGKPIMRLAEQVVDAWLAQGNEPMTPSSARVADAWLRQSRKLPLDAATVAQFRKDFLMFMKNINQSRIRDYDDLEQFRNAVLLWSTRFEEFGRQIREDLEGRIRVWKNQKSYEQGGDIQWAEWYLKNMTPYWNFLYEFRHLPEFVSLSYVKKYKPGYTDEEHKERIHQDFMAEAKKWSNRVKSKARANWKYLNDLVGWTERGGLHGGGRENTVLTDLVDEKVQLHGFPVLFKGFEDAEWMQKYLPLLKEGLKRYRQRASVVFPWLLQHKLPLEIYWTRGSGSAGASYERTYIKVSPWGIIGEDPLMFAHLMAHEMGHHVWRTYLSAPMKDFWSKAIRGDYKSLNLRDALKVPGSLEAKSMGQTHPILYLQLKTLINDPAYKYMDLFSKRGIQEHLDKGGDPIVRVPTHPITGYAGKNTEEAFCEALGRLVAFGPKAVLGPIQGFLRTILPEARLAHDRTADQTGKGESVGIFIPLPAKLAKQFPPKDNDPSPQHVTFIYAGEVSPDQADDVLAIMQKHLDDVRAPVKARLGELDYFEHGDRRIPHIAVNFSADMAHCRDRILTGLREYGIVIKEFSPLVYRAHTTLAYLEDGEREFKGTVPKGSWEFNSVEVWGLPKAHKLMMGNNKKASSERVVEAFLRQGGGGNQAIIEAPHHFHKVKLEPPKAKRKKWPFEGYIDFQGIKIDVENATGSTRTGVDPDGHPWSIKMYSHYGEIRGTEGTDGDKLDVYVGENHDSSVVVVIHQIEPSTGKFDEDKVMLGYDSVEEAIGAYKKQYDKPGFYRAGEHLEMPIGQFWRWVGEKRNKGKKVKDAAARVAAAYLSKR